MIEILIAMVFGFTSGGLVSHQHSYCECKRDDFKGAYCHTFTQSKEDSCHK